MANPKLTQEKVDAIRKALKDGETGVSLAKRFKVHRQTIYVIKVGKTWAHKKRKAS